MVIEDREFITLLGPSGCGKTTTLRMIAGLETPTEGRITIGNRVVFDSELGINVSPAKRDIGFLFQNYALWPHMTVQKNIEFGLSNLKGEMAIFEAEYIANKKLVKIVENFDDVTKVIESVKDKNVEIVLTHFNPFVPKGAIKEINSYIKPTKIRSFITQLDHYKEKNIKIS